jgi:hypothetical protein
MHNPQEVTNREAEREKNPGTAARVSHVGAGRNFSSSGDGREASQEPYLDTR